MRKLLYLLPVLALLFAACEKEENTIEGNGQENTGTSGSSDNSGNTNSSDSSSTPVGNYVDLGLSVKWATMNVGATEPEEYGDYFAWGEIEPYYEPGYAQDNQTHWKSGKENGYSEFSYKYCNDGMTALTKYCTNSRYGYNGYTDNKMVLDPEDDAAHFNLGDSWRIPTREEWEELNDSNNCTWTWITMKTHLNYVKGYKVQSKKIGYTDNWIFLPAAGYRFDSNLHLVGSSGNYWSSSLCSGNPDLARNSKFDKNKHYTNIDKRSYGFTVRPVCP